MVNKTQSLLGRRHYFCTEVLVLEVGKENVTTGNEKAIGEAKDKLIL